MKHIKIGIKITIFFAIVCGLIYPLVLTGIGQVAANKDANGSLIYINGKAVGSKYIGQDFNNDPRYFHGRPSDINYDTTQKNEKIVPESGTNVLAPSSKELQVRVKAEVDKFIKENPGVNPKDLPAELFTQSASGLDPDITLQGAQVQIDRVAKNTGISKEQLNSFIKESEEAHSPSGETLINVLELNLKVAKAGNYIK
ncbi:potassium-transporting ATPase subunit C [uncultured Clostridium sp.]|uniref:potassium-transporting ATPase subunit C n=1 Tax=uncultured Clostridium sp. TaxID=59620 RepID=UPI002623887E|nr:potassium-transporting ATPase subunit C [uncultured Clostridium sp.]